MLRPIWQRNVSVICAGALLGLCAAGMSGATAAAAEEAAGTAAYAGQQLDLPVALDGLEFLDRYNLSDGQLELLQLNGFVVTPAEWREFYHLYDDTRYDDLPVFISSDALLHVYHLLFNKLLRDLEDRRFGPMVEVLTGALVEAAGAQYEEARGTALEDPARRVWGYFSVAQQLIAEEPPAAAEEIADEVTAELALIEAHGGIAPSPLLCLPEAFEEGLSCTADASPEEAAKLYCEDYSQYVPRGHYTRSPSRERYFRAMMWYGRINFRLKFERETRLALLITRIMDQTLVDGVPAADVWQAVYEPTAFLVGRADDLGFKEYLDVAEGTFGESLPLDALADGERLARFTDEAKKLPAPQINSMWVYVWEDEAEATRGFRFMGQRFVLDAYIFEQLIWRNVGEFGGERWLPMGLDVFAALGSDEAHGILTELGETDYANYEEQLAKVIDEVAALEPATWQSTVYFNWLHMLEAVIAPKDDGYPAFMRTSAWARKDLQAALGSWTELKHDTILYAKQVSAEMGGPEPVKVYCYVEPNPVFFSRLVTLTALTRTGLEERDLLAEDVAEILDELEGKTTFLLSVAQRELAGEEITEEEHDRLSWIGGWLEWMTMAAADQPEGEEYGRFYTEEEAAIVADVATDPNGQVLEEATGRVFEIYVVTPSWEGGAQVARGGVYSYYEFPWPMDDRLTDEKWRQLIADELQPDRPSWTEAFIAE